MHVDVWSRGRLCAQLDWSAPASPCTHSNAITFLPCLRCRALLGDRALLGLMRKKGEKR